MPRIRTAPPRVKYDENHQSYSDFLEADDLRRRKQRIPKHLQAPIGRPRVVGPTMALVAPVGTYARLRALDCYEPTARVLRWAYAHGRVARLYALSRGDRWDTRPAKAGAHPEVVHLPIDWVTRWPPLACPATVAARHSLALGIHMLELLRDTGAEIKIPDESRYDFFGYTDQPARFPRQK